MAEEVKTNETETKTENVTEKVGFFKKAWKTIVTGVVCAVVGGGVVAGADVAKIQEKITEAQAKQIAVAAAEYSAEQVIAKISTIPTSENKLKAVKEAVEVTTKEIPAIIEGVKAAKEAIVDSGNTVKEAVKETKDAKSETKTVDTNKVETAEVKK